MRGEDHRSEGFFSYVRLSACKSEMGVATVPANTSTSDHGRQTVAVETAIGYCL